jgi:hypothetical protein
VKPSQSKDGHYPLPVTRSKGGWRRKARRMTPFVIANYWPGTERLRILKRWWPSYLDAESIVRRINKFPAPKPVTVWQCKMMASHLRITRPMDFSSHIRDLVELGPLHVKPRLARRQRAIRAGSKSAAALPARPESKRKLRKVGRKPLVKRKTKTKKHARGLSMGRVKKAVRKARKSRIQATSIPGGKKGAGADHYTKKPGYIPLWFRTSLAQASARGSSRPGSARKPRASSRQSDDR